MKFKNTFRVKNKSLYVLLGCLFFLLLTVGFNSYKHLSSPYGLSELYGYQYLGMIAGEEVECLDCTRRLYFWDTTDPSVCMLKKLVISVSGEKEDLNVDVVSLVPMSVGERESEKGDQLFIFDTAVYSTYNSVCRK